jgi:NTP pyrophosphatase (non-canonical NTP hydrolase)
MAARVTVAEATAAYLAREAAARGGELPPLWHFAMKLTEEAQEAADAWHRTTGWCRRTDTLDHVSEELADTVISAYAMALLLGVDLDAAIGAKHEVLMTRPVVDR